ncbi:MAG: DUF3971 domain-containing protein [Alphaproteobacteria bacterium]|nr:DUF3971 domain-containing protein [Alphaproteobacteria bacterium]
MRHIKLTFKLILEGFAFCAAIVLLGIFLLAGRLMIGPVKFTELTPVFENLLSSPDNDVFAKINHSTLTWDKERRKAVLELNDIQFADKLQESIASIPQILLVLHPMGYFDEARSPWNVVIQNPNMHLRLDASGVMHLGAMGMNNDKPDVAAPEAKDVITRDELLTLFQDVLHSPNTRSAGLGLFANLTIINGGITLNDEGKQITWNLAMPALSLRRTKNNYAGKAAMIISKNKMQTAVDFTLAYDAAHKTYMATGSFDHLNPALFAGSIAQLKPFDFISSPLTGSISIGIDEDATVIDGGLNLNLDKGDIKLTELYPKPLPFKSGQIVARYNKTNSILQVEPLRFDFEKMVLQGKADIHVGSVPRDVNASFKLSDLPVEQFQEIWPEQAGKNARDWILENIHKGKLDEVVLNLGLTVPDNDVTAATIKDVHGTLKVSNVTMTCWKPLPNIEKLNGQGTFNEKGFDIELSSGEQGELKIKPSHVVISGLDADIQTITLDANIASPAATLLEVLDRAPMGYAKKMNIKPKETSGEVDGILHMSFPLLKELLFDQIELKADAKVTDGAMQRVAGLIDVSNGNVALQVDKNGLSFKGNAALNGVPSTVDWVERFASVSPNDLLSKASIKGNANADDIKKFGLDITMTSTQAFPVDVSYERSAARSKLAISGDATATKLKLSDLFYTKAAGSPFTFSTKLEWGGDKPMQLTELKARGNNITIDGIGTFDAAQHLSKLTINPLQLDETRAKAEFTRSKDGVPNLQVVGDVLDIRRAFDSDDKDKEASLDVAEKPPTPLQVDIQLKKIITGVKTEMNNVSVKGRRDTFGWVSLEASAMGKNKTPFNFNIRPSGERNILSMSTPNLGNILASLDVTDTMIGGKLAIDGKSEPGDKLRNIFGHIKLENFRVKNMPALAQLISAISPDGLAAMLGGEGLGFSDLDGEYVWAKNTIVITKAHTASGSLGLTTAGKIDIARSVLELEGQVIPVYFISRILSAIPLVGELLTGGDGQGLFAATYRVEGPISKARVSVNPVSVLAPGILRNILFMDKDITKMDKPNTTKH